MTTSTTALAARSAASPSKAVDLRDPIDRDHALRIGKAWTELRRGAGAAALRAYYFGKDDPLEQGQMDALDLLTRRDRTMKGLADRLRIDPSTATRAVQRIVNDGLAERFPSPDDGRVVMVRATEDGRRRHAKAVDRRATALINIVESFDHDELATLASMLERLSDAVHNVATALEHEADCLD
ncbi:MarR family winged helix-turn-helix transcriptional regulator [uncultured Ilumatobacter sp.]|jgi:DNA-binding MarR family transcriptional regulator|uniref:MarR family winged helix-turn-helix transcriptional regulator n=1 Tax=uncultured Ilumatobacter sp. TaxID=879968 RepID=UPI00374FA760